MAGGLFCEHGLGSVLYYCHLSLGGVLMAAKGKSINLFLMDNKADGRIKCTLANWTGVSYKIPRVDLDKCKDRKRAFRCDKQQNIS